ncbi:MAG: NADH-ubiquinone oxidoreductase-F iron-sulfur binding region domain-containing protein [Bacteroidales bacterium]|nr:NADH-ubiquinone oxidoreductase-F iron-sulfur binding region domain-containing protein [Bacteroidales bacterium]
MMLNSPQQIRGFLVDQVLLNPDREAQPGIRKHLSYLSGERVHKPNIMVGMASCGCIAGAGQTYDAIREYLNERDLDAELIQVGCHGFCEAEPVVDVQLPGKTRISFANVTSDRVQNLLDEVLNDNLPDVSCVGQYKNPILQEWEDVPDIGDHPFFSHQHRILMEHCGIIDPVSASAYIARGGYQAFSDSISRYTPGQLCEIIERSELAGRGGGAYPAGKKWAAALKYGSDQKYFVCNAVESDPGSYMNRAIIESNPHRLIEAILIASYAIGASKAFIFIRKEFSLAVKRLNEAISQAREYGIIGHHIFDSGVNIDIAVKEAARAFVCGEETALNNSIEGKRAMPSSKPPYPAEKGLWDKPTIVNNVETLFNVPLIVKNGPEWFHGIGTSTSKGTKLFTLSGNIRYYGTAEVPMGITFRDVVHKVGGGLKDDKALKAIVLGINSGSYIVEDTLDTRVDFDALKNIGAALGSGAFVVIDESICMVDLARFFTAFFKKESCGKCIPCREGTARMLEIMEQATRRPSENSSFQTLERFKGVMQLKSLSAVIRDTSLCALGKSSPMAILNTLKYFKKEFDTHVFERKCPANHCTDLREYFIDVDACTGCHACLKKCPADAIIGTPRYPHFIVQDKCIACGSCYDVCKFNAVLIK